jgi:membrane-bound lytic murein transglycosylase D
MTFAPRAASVRAIPSPMPLVEPVINDTSIHWLRFDPVLLQLSGHSEMDALNAPVITLNKQAVKFVDAYMVKNNSLLSKIKDKHPRYFKIMDEVFTKHKLPVQLKYLAIIESELNINATSHVGAKGPWQLMPGTARILDLKVSKKYDERTHFYKSTVAASKYLRDLYNLFEDWPLVIAALKSRAPSRCRARPLSAAHWQISTTPS